MHFLQFPRTLALVDACEGIRMARAIPCFHFSNSGTSLYPALVPDGGTALIMNVTYI